MEAEQESNLIECLKQEKFKKICIDLGIFSELDDMESMVDKIKGYINKELRGEFIGDYKATEKFFKCMDLYMNLYLKNNDFIRLNGNEYVPDGFIDFNSVLPISSNKMQEKKGLRVVNNILGFDGKPYIVKSAEGLKGNTSGRKYSRDGKYNPTVAHAFYKFLNQPCSKNIPAYEKSPYYYIFSENFLKENEKMYALDDDQFIKSAFELDTNNNIKHSQIMKEIEESVKSIYGISKKTIEICEKLKLQYSIQETLKNLIKSMDENLGNTAIIITENENGEMQDINISPAYDQDLSFLLGEEILGNTISQNIFYRTTDNGNVDLESIMSEFQRIPGYTEKMNEFAGRCQGDYINQIFNIAYKSSGVPYFKNREIKDRFGNFIMRRVAEFKGICNKLENQRSENNLIK